jgi:hypothetical protein
MSYDIYRHPEVQRLELIKRQGKFLTLQIIRNGNLHTFFSKSLSKPSNVARGATVLSMAGLLRTFPSPLLTTQQVLSMSNDSLQSRSIAIIAFVKVRVRRRSDQVGGRIYCLPS